VRSDSSRSDSSRWLLILLLTACAAPLCALATAPAQAPASQRAPANQVPAPASDLMLPAATTPQPTPAGAVTPTVPPPALLPATQEQLGDALEARQRYQAAIAAYAKDPHPSAAVWNKMGIAYQMMFNSKDAARCYRESLRLDSKNAMVLNNLGTLYDSEKEYSAAEKMYHKALKLKPDAPVILKNLGTNLLVQHKYSKGWEAYKRAMALDPGIFNDHNSPTVSNPTSIRERGAMNYYMARGCVKMGETQCALDYLKLALDEGFTTAKKLSADEDFAALRSNPAYQELLAEQKQPQHQ
jgi:tetratricopeptide (TPR) repeat protein